GKRRIFAEPVDAATRSAPGTFAVCRRRLGAPQPAPVLLLLLVLYFGLYAEKRLVTAAFAFSLAIAFKVFPVVLAIFPLFRRDWTFLSWTAGWCLLLMVGLPVICLGPATTFDLYRAMLTDHLA